MDGGASESVGTAPDPAAPDPAAPGAAAPEAATPSPAGLTGLAASAGPPPADAVTRLLGRFAVAAIGGAILIMVAIPAAGPSQAVVHLPLTSGPPWWLPLHPSVPLVTISLWTAAVAGGAGVAAGLAAVSRGARPPVRMLAGAALIAVAALTVLPPAGSTDSLDYAAYGRIVALGHDPYLMTPYQLRVSGDPVGRYAPRVWQHYHSVYGPLASAEEAAAAAVGGPSAARTVFWIKVFNTIAFGLVALLLDRLLRGDPSRRARAHLLWTLNPLLLWTLVAAGHIDTIAAAAGLAGLAVARLTPPARRPGLWRLLAAGALIGAAADIKITFVLFGAGLAWAFRRSFRALLACAGGALAVLAPSYLWFGYPAVKVLIERHSSATSDNLYQIISRPFGYPSLPSLMTVVLPVFAAVALLLLWRLPDGFPALPAVRPAFALSLAWLLTWPYQRAWYDAMIMCLIALYPASRLDWPVLARLVAGTFYSLPGMPGVLPVRALNAVAHEGQVFFIPAIRFGALVTVVVLCLTAAWHTREPLRLRLGAARVPS